MLHEGRTEGQIIPAGIGVPLGVTTVLELLEVLVGEASDLTSSYHRLVVEGSVLEGTHTIHQARSALHAHATRVADVSLTRLTALGGDEDDPVSSLRAVDSS